MLILGIESASMTASAALLSDDTVIAEYTTNFKKTHSETLLPMIDAIFQMTGKDASELTAIAVSQGPGSFTGVRIGVAAVKGLAFAENLPCIPVSTLESMANNCLGDDCIVCAAMDARCSQVYNALFRISGDRVERLCEDRALALTDLKADLQQYDEKIVLVGDGAALCAEFLSDSLGNVRLAPMNHRIQTASSVALTARESLKNGKTVSAEQLMPVYLRLPQAQRELNKRLGRE